MCVGADSNNKAAAERCVAVKHTQAVPAKRRARRARAARRAQTGRERR
jgi:hypothetical protein